MDEAAVTAVKDACVQAWERYAADPTDSMFHELLGARALLTSDRSSADYLSVAECFYSSIGNGVPLPPQHLAAVLLREDRLLEAEYYFYQWHVANPSNDAAAVALSIVAGARNYPGMTFYAWEKLKELDARPHLQLMAETIAYVSVNRMDDARRTARAMLDAGRDANWFHARSFLLAAEVALTVSDGAFLAEVLRRAGGNPGLSRNQQNRARAIMAPGDLGFLDPGEDQ